MAVSLKQEIETWVQALGHYDNNEFEEALRVFEQIADTSKILFNCGVIHATIGEHDRAVECYQRATSLDNWLAVAYFQQGVSNFLVGDFEEALANFNDTLYYLRGNTFIDYTQLGLNFRLYSCEVVFNRGLCYIYLQQEKPGMKDLLYAQNEKMAPDHDVIDDAIREGAMGYTVFSIPVGVVYRPNEAKVKNLKAKDYLGRARLIATSNSQNVSTGFEGAEKKQAATLEMQARDDRPPENISFAATNLVQRNLPSRGPREQSAPPAMGRPMFPPTPPPESEKPSKRSSAASTSQIYSVPARVSSVREPHMRQHTISHTEQSNMVKPTNIPRSVTADSVPLLSKPPPGIKRENSWHVSESDRLRIASPKSERTRPPPLRATSDPTRLQTPPQSSQSSRQTDQGLTRVQSPPQSSQFSRQDYHQRSASQRVPLFGEAVPAQAPSSQSGDEVEGIYRMYSRRQPRKRHEVHNLDEEDEYIEDGDINEDEMNNYTPVRTTTPQTSPQQNRESRRPDMRKIRVKVHLNDDTRYIMFGPIIDFGEFESKIREKFAIQTRLKIKMQDEGDMITMGDQDDLEMLLQNVKAVAWKERNEMGKMEVYVTCQ